MGEGETHGFKLAAVFAKGGELGPLWTIQRPQVYRALDHLERRAFVTAVRTEQSGSGSPRTLYALTELGERELAAWFQRPVEHLREVRSELLLKLIFLERQGLPAEPLVTTQTQRFSDVLQRYESSLAQAEGAERTALEWRTEMARAALSFLQQRRR